MLKQNYKELTTKKSLDMLLIDRKNEFRELATVTLIPQTKEGWEKYVLQFCMNIDDAFKIWTGDEKPKRLNADSQTMILLKMISRDQLTMTNVAHFLNMAYTLAQEFKVIYKRLG
tara:strand:+ start:168 stop:512 length:345 start_codon:yes stop_codon:yes gene_type:complete